MSPPHRKFAGRYAAGHIRRPTATLSSKIPVLAASFHGRRGTIERCHCDFCDFGEEFTWKALASVPLAEVQTYPLFGELPDGFSDLLLFDRQPEVQRAPPLKISPWAKIKVILTWMSETPGAAPPRRPDEGWDVQRRKTSSAGTRRTF
jgi:hypothetical protein